MSKIIDIIKKEKLKSIVIGLSCLIFIIGLVITITSTGETYAIETYACYYCNKVVEGNQYQWLDAAPNKNTCGGSDWEKKTELTTKEACGGDKYVTIYYQAKAGTIQNPDNDGHQWKIEGNSGSEDFRYIFKHDTTTNQFQKYYQRFYINSGTTVEGIVNYDNPEYINIYRDGYIAKPREEWKCVKNCNNQTYNQLNQYPTSAFCDASKENCTTVLEVNWIPLKYNVKLYDGDTLLETISEIYDITTKTYNPIDMSKVQQPEKKGYLFLGWNEDKKAAGGSTSTIIRPQGTKENEDITLYAIWSGEIKYEVWYHSNYPKDLGYQDTTTNQRGTFEEITQLAKNNFSATGYEFIGWSTVFEPTEDDIIYASEAEIDITEIAGTNHRLDLYAIWAKETGGSGQTYTISFNANEGIVSPSSKQVTYGNTYGSLPTPTRTGHEFKGWFTDKTGGTQITPTRVVNLTSNQTIFAQWEKITNTPGEYTIMFDPRDGSVTQSSKKVSSGSTYGPLPTPTRTGYEFKGWFTDEENGTKINENTEVKITGDQTLYAQWNAITYKVIYDKTESDATGNTAESIHTYGVAKKLTKNGYSRQGYEFKGWSETKNGTVKYSNEQEVSNLSKTQDYEFTLYAVWEKINAGGSTQTYTVTYDANGGEGTPDEQTKTYGKELTLSSTKPSKKGYTFLGWDTNKESTTANYNAGGTYSNNANLSLYAIWSANTYSIEYNTNNGTITDNTSSGTYDQEIIIKKPTKTVMIVGNSNGTDATIGQNVSTEIKFAGWTSTTIDTQTASYESTPWTNGNEKVTATKFKNLTSNKDGKVTMVANWEEKKITLPTVTKAGYTCNWDTKADGKGTDYESGGEYTITSETVSNVNLYAHCVNSPETGDELIVIAWLIGISALGYSVYYFRSRKSDI